MSEGKAELFSPESGDLVATLHEVCAADGSAKIRVVLKKPMKLKLGESLAIYAVTDNQPVISVGSPDPSGMSVDEFVGPSAAGCLEAGLQISFVYDPGGAIQTLLVVLGKGVVRRQR